MSQLSVEDRHAQEDPLLGEEDSWSDDVKFEGSDGLPEPSLAGRSDFWVITLILIAALIVSLTTGYVAVSNFYRVPGQQSEVPAPEDAPPVPPPSSSISSPSPAPSVSSDRQDYILDPNWDFNAAPTRRMYEWTVRDTEANPDGVFRPMILINDQFPGPLIECNDGDTIVVSITNGAANATSFHWHGIFQNGTNWMDGTVGVTQCPIAPGGKFTYEFKIEGQSGTYWYHAHMSVQASDGLFGPLIVHDKEEKQRQKVPYKTDRVVMVQDHYYDVTGALLPTYLKNDRENTEPVPDGALINGRNIRDCDALPHRKCDNSTAQRSRFDLEANENHRLRFINVGAFAEFSIQIDEHEFAVTEVDSTDVEPQYYHRLNINPGQRYSIVLTTNNTARDAYWLRAKMVTFCFKEINPDMEPEIWAVIQYNQPSSQTASTPALPESEDWREAIEVICKDMNTTELVPVDAIEPPIAATHAFYLRANFEIGAWRLSRAFFNSSSWRADPRSPSLARVLDGWHTSNESFTSAGAGVHTAFDVERELVLNVPRGAVIDIAIENFDDGIHPFHLHGHRFFVLASGHGYFHPENVYPTIDFSNPLRRDTASVETFGWTLIRFIADNPGLWAFHCHIAWHVEAGMLMQFLVGAEEMQDWEMPASNAELCLAQGIEKGMAPPDETWYGQ